MPLPHPLPDPLVELIARRFRVLGDPMRIRLLDRLREDEATVQELTEALGASQQNVSKHLQLLLDARVVSRRKQGTHAYYSIADDGVLQLCEQVCGTLQRQLADLQRVCEAIVEDVSAFRGYDLCGLSKPGEVP